MRIPLPEIILSQIVRLFSFGSFGYWLARLLFFSSIASLSSFTSSSASWTSWTLKATPKQQLEQSISSPYVLV